MALQVASARIPSGDNPVCGVTLAPYVLVRKLDSAQTIPLEDCPEEGSDARFYIRSRWYRAVVSRGGAVCCFHPDKEAAIQCVLCVRAKVDLRKSYHCSTECLRQHWSYHKELHEQTRSNGGQENGYAANSSFKAGDSLSSTGGGEAWIEVSKNRAYTPTAEDVGSILKYECVGYDAASPYGEFGKAFSVQTARVRPAPAPPRRSLVPLPPPRGAASTTSSGKFTVLTYNMLSDLYATSEQFGYCAPWCLAWQYRRQNLLKEVVQYNADILCLQEVQSNHFADFFEPELAKHGYTAIYKKKTAEIYTGGGTSAIDGCATFYKESRFALVKKYEVEFNKAAMSLSDTIPADQKKAALSRLLKDNVALIAVFEALGDTGASGSAAGSAMSATPVGPGASTRQPAVPGSLHSSTGGGGGGAAAAGAAGAAPTTPRRQLVCVANTHIHANPELNDVKLWQVHTLLKGLEKIAASADIPMLVAGDFNSLPGSAAHSLLVKRSVEATHPELSNDPLKFLRPVTKLHHQLPLASAYSGLCEAGSGNDPSLRRQKQRMDTATREPRFTNVGKDFKGTLDYILYTTDSLAPTSVLELPDESDVKPRGTGGLPNETWSSDHIALMAEFQYLAA